MSRYRNVVEFAFVAAAMAPALALHGSQQAGDAPAPAPARRAIGEDDCKAAKLGSEIPVEAISERVSAVTLSAPQWHAGTANSPAYCSIEGSMAPFDQRSTARPIRFDMALPASWSRRGAQLGGAGMNGSIPDVDRRHRAGQAYAARAGLRHIRQRLWNRRAGGIRPRIIQAAFQQTDRGEIEFF